MIDNFLERGVIEKVPLEEPSDWDSPAFFVPKAINPDTSVKLRLVTDFSKLNKFVKRPVHPFPSSRDIMRGIPSGTKYFCKLDAVWGYHQMPLDEESRKLTTFLLPSGRYRYKRGPMGLSSSNDEWCGRSDAILKGVDDAQKIVDDVLIAAPDLPTLIGRIRRLLTNCREIGLAMSPKKMKIDTSMPFAGYVVSPDGVHACLLYTSPSPRDRG